MLNFRLLYKYSAGYMREMLLLPLCVAVQVSMEVWIPYLMGDMLDMGIYASDMEVIKKEGLLMLLASLIMTAAGIIISRCISKWSSGVTRNIRDTLFARAQELSFSDSDRFGTASILTRMSTDVSYVKRALGTYHSLLSCPIIIISTVIVTLKAYRSAAPVFIGGAICLIAVSALVVSFALGHYRRMLSCYDEMNDMLDENITAQKTVKAFARGDFEEGRFRKIIDALKNENRSAEMLTSMNEPLLYFVMNTSILILILISGRQIIRGSMQAGDLFCLISYADQILFQISVVAMIMVPILNAQVSMDRIREVTETVPSIRDGGSAAASGAAEATGSAESGAHCDPNAPAGRAASAGSTDISSACAPAACAAQPTAVTAAASETAEIAGSTEPGAHRDPTIPAAHTALTGSTDTSAAHDPAEATGPAAAYETAGSVTFSSVSMCYFEGKNVLEHINITIKPGEFIGIIGSSGSGKTSLINLIPRFYDCAGGSVSVGGRDVRSYALSDLRDEIGLVPQSSLLFTGTIAENLRWGNENASAEEIVDACVAAGANDFVMSFPDGYNTLISQGGSTVSGGQRQRLCIARALIKKPKILILDDSLSAVDNKTEVQILEALGKLRGSTTVIMVSQRFSSVMGADRIVVIDEGRIDAAGTHEELLRSSKVYREIYDTQRRQLA